METILHYLTEHGPTIGGVIGLLLMLLSALSSTFAGNKSGISPTVLARHLPDGKESQEQPRLEADSEETLLQKRLEESGKVLQRQKSIARHLSWASSSLIIGQYVIGGAITSSTFLQENLSKTLIGCLGLLVFLSAIFRQQFRPDVKFHAAKKRCAELQALIRNAENQLSFLKSGEKDALSKSKIINLLSKGLADVEMSEVDEDTKTLDGSASV